jgi:hypothetical protein
MRRLGLALVPLAAAAALAVTVSVPAALATAPAVAGCRTLTAPSSLGATLLRLHRAYMQHQPDVHNPKITGPVGRVYLGICGTKRWALAVFDARYNDLYFGVQDQPERFDKPAGAGWQDLGNTGGDPCGSAPLALLKAWKIVHACPPAAQ